LYKFLCRHNKLKIKEVLVVITCVSLDADDALPLLYSYVGTTPITIEEGTHLSN